MKKLRFISCLLITICLCVTLCGCKDKQEEEWIHTTQYYNYLTDYPECKVEIKIQAINKGFTELSSCYDGKFGTSMEHLEFKILIYNNAPSNFVATSLALYDVYFKFNNDLVVNKMYLYMDDYTEDYASITIRSETSYTIYLRILYSGDKYDGNTRIEGLEDDYIIKLWDIRI